MDNMKETILRDGEVAILIGGAEVIMNENTLLSLLEKFGLVEKVENAKKPSIPEDKDKMFDAIIAKLSAAVPAEPAKPACPYTDGISANLPTKPVAVFEYDKEMVTLTGNRYSGFVRCVKWFDSAQEAEDYYGLSNGRVSAVARSWAHIIQDSWDKKLGKNNQYASRSTYSGSYDWGIPYSFTATDCDGNTLAFIYIEDLPKNFLV